MRRLSPERLFAAMRITTGVSLLYYQVFIVWPMFDSLYGPGSIVDPEAFSLYVSSPLFGLWESPGILRLAHACLLIALGFMTIGYFARAAHALALVFAVAFHHANPMIIHEPQQLGLLAMWALLFVPIERAWTVRPTPFLTVLEDASPNYLRRCAIALLVYLSSYYAFAGLKKLPDPAWLSGRALGHIIDWPPLRRSGALAELVRVHAWIATLGTYGALMFELGFPFVAATRYRAWLIPLGIILHGCIGWTLEVGHFATAITAWYPLLLTDLSRDPRGLGPSS